MRAFPLGLLPCGLGVSTHGMAQSITSAPATVPVPVDHPLVLVLLAAAIGLCAFAALRKHRVLAALLPVLAGSMLVWQSQDLRALLLRTFTHPAGETMVIPVQRIPAGFEVVDYRNDSGAGLVIRAIVPPDRDACFPGGSVGELPPPVTLPNPPAACAVGLQLAHQATCRVDVDAICRALVADTAPSVIAISPANGAVAATTTTIQITFSEPVNVPSAAAFSLECASMPMGYTVTTPPTLPASATTVVLTPAGGLPGAQTCTVTVFADSVTDSDTMDPPDTMAANFVSTFTTATPP